MIDEMFTFMIEMPQNIDSLISYKSFIVKLTDLNY